MLSPLEPGLLNSPAFHERYEVVSRLGSGSFGQVYKARQRATEQHVAVKVLQLRRGPDAPPIDRQIARFRREMRLCAQLYHPNIVRLIDSGEVADELVYTVFEFVPGKTLAEVLAEEGALKPVEAIHLLTQVLDALGCAHAAGVVHRDLKPHNIMVTASGVRRNALVLDFGIGAIIADPDGADRTRLTATHESVGTPAYAAPEQLRGEPVTPRADLYAWGLVFLESLTGQVVMAGRALSEVLFKQLGPDPVHIPSPLSETALGDLLRAATVKNADERDVSAESLLRQLEAIALNMQLAGIAQARAVDAQHATLAMPVAVYAGDKDLSGDDTLRTLGWQVPAGERRQLTALCCSLSLAGQLRNELDIEELDALHRLPHGLCLDVAARYDAFVASALGDSVMLYFGFPTAREGDTRRALTAAWELLERAGRESAQLEAKYGVRLELRIGIHTGLVTADSRDTFHHPVVGATPDVAVRLARQADAGAILLSEASQAGLRNQFSFESRDDLRVQTSIRKVAVYRALSRGPVDPGVAFTLGDHPQAMVGRSEELELLQQRWQQARAGQGQNILVLGEAGIGKSRLVHELRRTLRSTSYTPLECRCAPETRDEPMRPIVDLLEHLIGSRPGGSREEAARLLEGFLDRYGFDKAETLPIFAPLMNLPLPEGYNALAVAPQKQKELTSNALLSLIFEMAERQAVLLLVEDLHWADPSTMEFLTLLVQEVPTAKACVVFTARPDFAPPWPAAQVLQIQLSRLSNDEVRELVQRLTGGKGLPEPVLEQVVGRTDGVPIFVEELTRMVVQSDALREEGDRYALVGSMSDLSIPTTLRDSLMARLDRLEDARETAALGAALGREFDHELLAAVSPQDEAGLNADLEALIAADLIYRRRRLRGRAYMFKHALIRDVAYETLLKPARRQVHARIAATLETRFPELVESRPELLKHHYAEAGMPPQAVAYALRAGRRAAQHSANAEAELHLSDGLRWLDQLEPSDERKVKELELRGTLAATLTATRGFAAAEVGETLDRVATLVGELGDSPEMFPSRWTRWNFFLNKSRHLEALRMAEENLEVAEKSGHPGNILTAHLALGGGSLFNVGRHLEAKAHLEQAWALYEGHDQEAFRGHIVSYGVEAGVTTLMQIANLVCCLGEVSRARKAAADGLALARKVGHVHSEGMALALGLQMLHELGDRPAMKRQFVELHALCEKHDLPHWLGFGSILHSWAEFPEDVGALDRLIGIIQFYESTGSRIFLSGWFSLLADGCRIHGRYDQGLAYTDQGLAFAAETEERLFEPTLHRVRGELLEATGNLRAAETSMREGLEVARRQSGKLRELKGALSLARLLSRQDRRAEARAELAPVVAGFEDVDLVYLREAREVLG